MSSRFPLITLLTDFGSHDTYVGQMKGAILSVCPDAQLVDLAHELAPGDIPAAAIAWADAVRAFPPGTIHLGVVDPGVGSERRGIAAEIGDWKFVCPDNGLLTMLRQTWPLLRAVELRNPQWWQRAVSPVFHGRDVFGPVAGHWAAGRDLLDFGPMIVDPLIQIPIPVPETGGRTVVGQVIAVDRFGNLRTNIVAARLIGPSEGWTFEIGPHTVRGLSRYFGEQPAGMPLALIGSHGFLEIAVNQGNAAQQWNAAVGTTVRVTQSKT